MNKIKKFISQNFWSFAYFYRELRYRLFLLIVLSIGVGILDGFGIAMFLPLLELVSSENQTTGSSLGNLNFLVDGIENLGLQLNITTVLLVMIAFFIAKGLAIFITNSYQTIVRQYFIRNLREKILDKFNKVSYKYFAGADVGRIQNTMSSEVERVSAAFQYYSNSLEQMVLVLVYTNFAFFVDLKFAILVTLGGWMTNFLYKIIYGRTKDASRSFTKDSHLYQGQIIQHVANFKYLKATSLVNNYANRIKNSIYLLEKSRRKMGILNAILIAGREPILIIVIAIVILIQTELFQAPLGPILVSLLFFYRALTALISVQNSYNRFLEVSGSTENVIDFQNEMNNNKDSYGKYNFESFKNYLELKNVYFSYNSDNILHDINIKIEKNETVAFVGESGSGKTTLMNIICGLIKPQNGSFTIDEIPASEIYTPSYTKSIGYITQEPVIFDDTIFNNITFWSEKSKINLNKFYDVLRKANIFDFVMILENKEDSLLGNNGINLSGGQKQRISIARELYKDVDILIMDEATSSLDSETEKTIQRNIDELKGSYTILIVAHRISTIKNADKIVILKNGKILHVGSYDKLLEKSITFKKMVQMQEL